MPESKSCFCGLCICVFVSYVLRSVNDNNVGKYVVEVFFLGGGCRILERRLFKIFKARSISCRLICPSVSMSGPFDKVGRFLACFIY